MWKIKIREGYLRSKKYQPYPGPLVQCSSARKISPYNFWLKKSVGVELVEETSGVPSSCLKEPTYGLTQIHSL